MPQVKASEGFSNLFTLVGKGLITTNTIALYLYYKLKVTEQVTLKQIKKYVGLSASAVQVHNALLETLGLLVLDRPQKPGRVNTVVKVHALGSFQLRTILKDDALLSQLVTIKEDRFNKYNLKAQKADQETYSRTKYSSQKTLNTPMPEVVRTVISVLPEKHRVFTVVPKQLKLLKRLDTQLDLKAYTNWFYRQKLKSGIIKRFNLGIFLYQGIVEEYQESVKKIEKTQVVKKTRSSQSANLQKKAEKASRSNLEKEFGNL